MWQWHGVFIMSKAVNTIILRMRLFYKEARIETSVNWISRAKQEHRWCCTKTNQFYCLPLLLGNNCIAPGRRDNNVISSRPLKQNCILRYAYLFRAYIGRQLSVISPELYVSHISAGRFLSPSRNWSHSPFLVSEWLWQIKLQVLPATVRVIISQRMTLCLLYFCQLGR